MLQFILRRIVPIMANFVILLLLRFILLSYIIVILSSSTVARKNYLLIKLGDESESSKSSKEAGDKRLTIVNKSDSGPENIGKYKQVFVQRM